MTRVFLPPDDFVSNYLLRILRALVQVRVEGLGPSTSWQDLKDFARRAGQPTFTNVYKNEGIGIVEFSHPEDVRSGVCVCVFGAVRGVCACVFWGRFVCGAPTDLADVRVGLIKSARHDESTAKK